LRLNSLTRRDHACHQQKRVHEPTCRRRTKVWTQPEGQEIRQEGQVRDQDWQVCVIRQSRLADVGLEGSWPFADFPTCLRHDPIISRWRRCVFCLQEEPQKQFLAKALIMLRVVFSFRLVQEHGCSDVLRTK
jgi:hypothetical protein